MFGHRRRLSLISIVPTLLALSMAGFPAIAGADAADPDPALAGVCYATLGNNAANPGALITVDINTGAGTLVGPTGIVGGLGDDGVPALAISAAGKMMAVDIGTPSNLYQIDATTGAATLVAATTLNSVPALAYNGYDALYAVDNTGSLHVVIDSTGVSRLIGPTGAFIKGLAFDPLDGTLWGTDASGGVYTIDIHSGAATPVGNTGLPATPDIHFDAAGFLYGSSGGGFNTNNLISINKNTGVGQVIGSIGFASVAGMAARLDRIVPATLQTYDSYWDGNHVEVTWRLIAIEGAISFEVLRAVGGGHFEKVDRAAIAEYRDEFTFVDFDAEPGKTYRYRIVVQEDGVAVASFESSITTPATRVSLGQNYPNPFNPTTQISFVIDNSTHASLAVFDASGRLVHTLVDRALRPGTFVESWDGRDADGNSVASGVYFFRLTAGKQVLTRKAVLLK